VSINDNSFVEMRENSSSLKRKSTILAKEFVSSSSKKRKNRIGNKPIL